MKNPMTILVTGSLLLITAGVVNAYEPDTSNIQQARSLIKQYAGNLKHELKTAIKQEGLAKAVEVCHLKAPDIARDASKQSGWTVRRTSLKVRNLEDAPDKWEFSVLKQFEARKQAGEPVKTMEYSEKVTKNGQTWFRYMKAIPTQKICLQCHGEKIDSKVSRELDSLYPFDQATGFKVGDIRGAFSLSKKLNQ